MKWEWLFWISLSLLLTFLFFLGIEYDNTIEHENVHKAIYNYYGYPATVTINGLSGHTQASIPVSEQDSKAMYPLHIENEIIGYNLKSIRNVMYIIIFLLTFNVFWKIGGFEK